MARRKQEVQLQQEIETTEEWEEMLAKEGLWVVDIYQEWCGPCAALVGNFRRLKNELGDDLLHFAAAKADTVDALDKYRGRCEPCFLFFAGGVLVACIHGANSPVILRTITEQLAAEHKVMDGSSERKEIKDPLLAGLDDREKAQFDEEENEKEEEEKKGFTVAIIKPDAVRNGKVDEILQQMEESGIEILAKEERQLTEEEAREFYSHLQDEEYFEDYVKFMSSGPSFALVLTKGQEGEDIIQSWRDMIGPTSVEEAKEQAPDSLRAKYGSDNYTNALHGSDSPETAAREMAFFFPDMAQPTVFKSGSKTKLQRTLALIRPDALMNNKDEILAKIKEAGFKVALQKEMTLTKEQAEEFYKEHRDKDYFEELTTRMSSGPLLALGLAREDAVQAWRDQLGPTVNAKEEAPESLRAQFAVDDANINMLHGSDAPEAAEKELEYFFPMQQTIAAIKPDAYGTKDDIIEKIHEAGFRIAARKETTITKDIAEEFYGDHKDKEYFDDLVNHMTSGPTMFMVLSREDAVTGWRDVIGPTDPEKAKTEAPESIRAKFGKDILHNAIHGSSDPDHAKQSIEKVFGHLEFNPDGTVKEEQPAKEQEEEAVVDTGAGEEAADVAPEFRDEEKEGDSQETKQQETSDDTEQAQSEGTAQKDEEGDKKEGEQESEPKAEGEEQEAKGGSGEEQAEAKQEEGASEQKESSEETKDETNGEDKTEDTKGEDKTEEAKGDDSKGGESKEEESKGDEAKGEESKGDEAKGEESKGDEAKGEETKGDEVKGEESKGDEAKGEESKSDDVKTDDAKGDDAKGEDSKVEDAKDDDKKTDDAKADDEKKDKEKGEEAAKTEEGEKKEEEAKKDDDKTEEAKT